MDYREAFLTAWRDFHPKGKLPDTDFLQFCDFDGDFASDEHVLERFNLCNERLEDAIRVFKSEGFILKWLRGVLNVNISKGRDLELERVLNVFFPCELNQPVSCPQDIASPSVAIEDVKKSDRDDFEKSSPLEDEEKYLNNTFAPDEECKDFRKDAKVIFPPRDEPKLALDGSDGESCFNDNIQGTSGVDSGKLFSSENNEFDEEKSSSHDGINIAEGNKLSANNNTEKESVNDVGLTRRNDQRDPTGYSEDEEPEMGDETPNLNYPERKKPTGHRNRALASVFSPLAKGINKAKSKGKSYLTRPSGPKHRRHDSHGSTTSGDDVDFSDHAESKTSENLESEILSDSNEVDVKLHDICASNQFNMADEGDSCLAPIDRGSHVDFTRQGFSENNALDKKDSISEEDRCKKEKIAETPDVIIEVVDELISYLEGIEVVSSDDLEGESPHASEGDDFMLFGGPNVEASPPPIRPPRRSKTERRSRTVGSPKKLGPVSADDDDVFGKDDKGYEENEELKKLRKARGAHVVIGDHSVDFSSSPVPSPGGSPAKHVDPGAGDKAEKLHKRKWVVAGVLDGEKGYLECLNLLYKHMKPLKFSIESSHPILTSVDYNKIFHKLDELHTMHSAFYNELETRVSHWSDRHLIGDLFLSLVDQFDVYKEYISNYNTAMSTVRKCKASNEQFNNIFSKELRVQSIQEVTKLQALFNKPVERVGRYIAVLKDLIKETPEEHADFELLTNVLNQTKDFLAKINGDERDGGGLQRVKRDHRLIKDGFIVELSDGVRKFRHLFLFNDYIICTKRKITARSEQYVCKWYLSLHDLQFQPTENSEAPQVIPVTSKGDFDLLKSRIASTKAEIRREEGVSGLNSPDSSPSMKRRRAQSASKIVEKLKRRLAEQEAALLLAIPSLPVTLYHKQGKTYTLLCKTDVERAEWKEAIIPLLEQIQDNTSAEVQLSALELHHLLEACKKLRTQRSLGKVSMKEDKSLLNGLLYVHIHSGRGFHKNDLSCVIEVDHYGQFVRKARTKTCKASTDPVWDQDFDVEVEGTRELKLHVYSKSRLNFDEHCAQGKIELVKENLRDLKKQTITITLDKQGAVTLSLQYSKTPHGIQRKKSYSEKGVFGVDIATVSKREESDIPLVVIGCVQEIEKRGIEEVGIYRLSGATSDVRRLKDAFDNNSQSALVQVAEADIHAVAGLLKMYLRDLPEPLFTDDLYIKFVEANGIKDPEEKKKKMMELFESLPKPNRLTIIYLLDHLRRLSEHQEQNKMGQNNLATVFGPNVLRPSSADTDPTDLAKGTLDVMSQVGIFLWFLKFCSLQLPEDPQLMRRLDPNKNVEVAPALGHEDRLI
ncbi:hypothetical protein pdam_00022703 [Pocillopora damicornis]|uniref:Active breakpoint cluster region-related protein n=1 Tax=Pocillopora damicornis TaxID=46731 RepID=A0A3M6TWW1_POCDA|nr:hypothetical protein pdam_00022703 [Pocillopora damicornis]